MVGCMGPTFFSWRGLETVRLFESDMRGRRFQLISHRHRKLFHCFVRYFSMAISLDEFAFRQFDDPNYSGTKISFDKGEFEKKVNEYYAERKRIEDVSVTEEDGYGGT